MLFTSIITSLNKNYENNSRIFNAMQMTFIYENLIPKYKQQEIIGIRKEKHAQSLEYQKNKSWCPYPVVKIWFKRP